MVKLLASAYFPLYLMVAREGAAREQAARIDADPGACNPSLAFQIPPSTVTSCGTPDPFPPATLLGSWDRRPLQYAPDRIRWELLSLRYRDGTQDRCEFFEKRSPGPWVTWSEKTRACAQPLADGLQDQHGFQPSWSEFRFDVGRSFGSFFSRENLLPGLLVGAATGISSTADESVQRYFAETERLGKGSEILGNPALLAGSFGTLMAVGWFGGNERLREATYDLALGLLVNNTVTFGTKVAVRRRRPDGGNFSFPSGHASNLFTIAAILGDRYGPKVSIPLHALAAMVSVSRMDVNSHWLSDTVAGAGLGLLVGHSIVRFRDSSRPHPVTWMPIIAPGKVGIVLVIDGQNR